MILYFSATGNSQYVAQRIAEQTGEEVLSVVDCVREERYSFADNRIGIISQTYNWGLPSVARDFFQKAKPDTDYLYFVATYGTTPGGSGYFAQKYLGKPISAFYSVRMPDTWTVLFDLSTPEAVAKFTKTTENEIDAIISHITSKDKGQFMRRKTPAFMAKMLYATYDAARATSHLSADDSCIGCGLCELRCPDFAITVIRAPKSK